MVLTKKVPTCFHDDLAERRLWGRLNMLLNESIDLLPSTSVVTSLDGMVVVSEINAGPLH